MKVLKFLVRYPDGRAEDFTVEGDRVLIGSGAHCEIRLPVDQAAMEHVLVTMGPTSAIAEARAFDPPPTINGSPFQRVQVTGESLLGIGSTQISVNVVEIAGQVGVVPRKQEKTSPMTYVLAAIAVPVSLYIILSDSGGMQTPPPPSEFPELFEAPITSCPHSDPRQAMVLANDKLVLAQAKRERRPFDVQDGVAAVPLYEAASACFSAANEAQAAAEADADAKKLRHEVGEDYRTHRVRLDHAISVKDWRTVQQEVRVLLALTEGKQGEYVTWLSNIDRKLQLKYGKKNR